MLPFPTCLNTSRRSFCTPMRTPTSYSRPLYHEVPSFFLSFMTEVDADQCWEGIDGLFLLQDVKDFQAMMQQLQSGRVFHAAKRGNLQ